MAIDTILNLYKKKKLERLNGNVIKLPIEDEWWKIRDEEAPKEDDETRRKKPGARLASYEPEIDNAIIAFEFWSERWLAHPYRNRFKTLKDFISWSMSNEDQPFHKGGLVNKKKSGLASLAESAVASDLLKKVISGKVALQFAPPRIQRKMNEKI